MTSIAQRLRDLSVQGANSTYSSSSRNAMQKEGDELVAELLRIKESTEFNGIKIFGSGTAVGGAENTDELDFAPLPMMAMGEMDFAPASADSSGVTGDFIGTVNQITEENIPEGYTAIRTVEDLNNIRNNLSGNYILMNDLDLSSIANWNPIGYYNSASDYAEFSGDFNGNGYVIKNLTITSTTASAGAGLFGKTAANSNIKNLGLEDVNITSNTNYTGALVGHSQSNISNCYSTGTVTSNKLGIGGLIGYSSSSSSINIENSYSTASVTCNPVQYSYIGGFIGTVSTNSHLKNCYATGATLVNGKGGGFAGAVSGTNVLIENCYAFADIYPSGTCRVGGFVGNIENATNPTFKNCFTVSNTIPDNTYNLYNGGFAGEVYKSSGIKYQNCMWNMETSGKSNGTGNSGTPSGMSAKTTAQMQDPATYVGWDTDIWDFSGGYPTIKHAVQPDPPTPPDPPIPTPTGLTRLQIGTDSSSSSAIYVDTQFNINNGFSVDFSTEESSRQSIETIDAIIDEIISKNGKFGASMNRLESVLESQSVSRINLAAAKSTIVDADIAQESSKFIKEKILQQASATLISQTSQIRQSFILSLLP